MPEVSATITFATYPLVLPDYLKGWCDQKGIDTSAWWGPTATWGRANSFRSSIGPEPSKGYILLRRSDWDLIPAGTRQLLQFQEDQTVVSFNVYQSRAIAVTGAVADDPNAVMLIEVTDQRYFGAHDMGTVEKTFNVPRPEAHNYYGFGAPAFYTESLDGQYPYTWQRLTEEVWNGVSGLAGSSGLPYSPNGIPIGWAGVGVNAYGMLNCLLDRLDCALRFDRFSGQVDIVRWGGTENDYQQLQQLLDQYDSRLLLTDEPEQDMEVSVAATCRVLFHSRNWAVCQDHAPVDPGSGPTDPTAFDGWRTKPTHSEVGTPAALAGLGNGNQARIWDDLPAMWSYAGAWKIVNDGDLVARAQERADNYARRHTRPAGSEVVSNYIHRVFSGLCDGVFEPSGILSTVSWYDIGNGIKTEILHKSTLSRWDESCDCTPCENVMPPDIIRVHGPYERLAWAKITEEVPPFECGWGKLLEFQEPAIGTGCTPNQWDVCAMDPMPIYDVAGQGAKPGRRVVIKFEWQSARWTIVSGLGGEGGEGEWWSEVFERWGPSHSHREIRWIDSACEQWEVVPGGRAGYLNAFDVNCAMHNSQEPLNPIHVRMHGPYFDKNGFPFYLFDENHTDEYDIERYRFVP